MPQLTLDLEPTTIERWPSLREFIAYRSMSTTKPAKAQAADMDLAPSTLSRKLNPAEGDTQRFNVDDLERWLESTGEAGAIVGYLAAKFLGSDDERRARTLSEAEALVKELVRVLPKLHAQAEEKVREGK